MPLTPVQSDVADAGTTKDNENDEEHRDFTKADASSIRRSSSFCRRSSSSSSLLAAASVAAAFSSSADAQLLLQCSRKIQ